MKETEGYDVLRLIEHNETCYVSSEYVEGCILARWLPHHPYLEKEQLFSYIYEIARQLEYIHRCRGNPCYRYVNPYSIIVTEGEELYFLDMNAQSNEKMLLLMKRRKIREHFLPPEEAYYQTESIALDIYGLGKTIQYFLSMSQPDPCLTKREELRFQQIISKCQNNNPKKSYQKVSEIRRRLPYCRGRSADGKKIRPTREIVRVSFLLVALVSGLAGAKIGSAGDSREPEENRSETSGPKEKREADRLRKQVAFLYFLEKKDYKESRKYFADVSGEEAAEGMADLAEYMEKGSRAGSEEELLLLLKKIEAAIAKEGEKEQENYRRCLIEGYRRVDTPDAAEAVVRLGNQCSLKDPAAQKEIDSYLAAAYEKTGNRKKATEKYEEVLEQEEDAKIREELYWKLTLLYEKTEGREKAKQICRKGIEERKDSKKLRLQHIVLFCADPAADRNVCAQVIREHVQAVPELTEETAFKKLQQEYGIVMEGDAIWVGR